MPLTPPPAASLDRVRQLIVDRMRDKRLSFKDLSHHVGKNEAYMNQFVKRGTPKILPEDVRLMLAEKLGLPADMLRHEAPPERAPYPSAVGSTRVATPALTAVPYPPMSSIPLFTVNDQIDDSLAHEWVDRPTSAHTTPGAYALWIENSTDRLRPGDMAFIQPGRPPSIGDLVVVIENKRVLCVGELKAMDRDTAHVATGPDKPHPFVRKDVTIQRVVAVTLR